jgi:hypothetical protein
MQKRHKFGFAVFVLYDFAARARRLVTGTGIDGNFLEIIAELKAATSVGEGPITLASRLAILFA